MSGVIWFWRSDGVELRAEEREDGGVELSLVANERRTGIMLGDAEVLSLAIALLGSLE